jgi:two-component system, OmpR family, response regulator QseB
MTKLTGPVATIVVCEDDDATLELLCDRLAVERFDVLPAPSAADALRLCRYGNPDMVVLDLSLPDGSGLEVLRTIRGADGDEPRLDPRLPVIVLTGRGGATDRNRALDGGADDYVQKPFLFEELRARITAILRRGHSRHAGPLRIGEILIDPARHTVSVGGRQVRLA